MCFKMIMSKVWPYLWRGVGLFLLLIVLVCGGYYQLTRSALNAKAGRAQVIDVFNGVTVHYNGGVNESYGRHLAADGYNLGIKYQCVEFVKRYYYQRFAHKMPDSYGHARDFFDRQQADGALNPARGLLQFANGGRSLPQPEDILVFGPSVLNPYGHVAIVTEVNPYAVMVIQQNAGPVLSSREAFPLQRLKNGGVRINDEHIRGWLRLPMVAVQASAPVSLDS